MGSQKLLHEAPIRRGKAITPEADECRGGSIRTGLFVASGAAISPERGEAARGAWS